MKKCDETKKMVLMAANARFEQYGFNKTTMAEIAKDSGMSAGNLYRFFGSKEDIVTEIAAKCFDERRGKLKEILKSPKKNASAMLESFVLVNLHHTHEMYSKQKHIFELVEFISKERRGLLCGHMNDLLDIISEILKTGTDAGEFNPDNIHKDSMAILNAVHKFMAPHFMGDYSLEEMETGAKGVLSLIFRGLLLRPGHKN